MVYCSACAKRHDFPTGAVRSSRAPCEICGGHDSYKTYNRITGEEEVKEMPNFSRPNLILPGTKEDINTKADREYEGQDV